MLTITPTGVVGERRPTPAGGFSVFTGAPITGRLGASGIYLANASEEGDAVRLWRYGAAGTRTLPRRAEVANVVVLALGTFGLDPSRSVGAAGGR